MDAHTARRLTVAAVAATAVALAGCTQGRESAAVDRGGTPATTVLRFATIDAVQPGGEIEFINAVEDVSGGRLILDVVTEYGEASPEAEADLVRAVAGGSLDLGIAATRGYAERGSPACRRSRRRSSSTLTPP